MACRQSESNIDDFYMVVNNWKRKTIKKLIVFYLIPFGF